MSEPSSGSEPEIELNELISLAEKSTMAMDSLAAEFSQAQLQLMFISFGTLISSFVSLLAALSAAVGSLHVPGFENFASSVLLTLGLLLGAGGAYVINTRLMNLRRVKRDLALERDICGRLLSMIDDQYRRVRRESDLSAVALATIEIRIKRLDRSKEH